MTTMLQSNRRRQSRGVNPAGFTLIEMMLAMTITVMVMVGVLSVFQMSARVAKKQTQLADLQQNLRVALYDTQRYARMAGRGGLPTFLEPDGAYTGHLLPNGASIAVGNNVADGTRIGNATSPKIVPGTDTLTIRGVLFGSVYQAEVSVPRFAANTVTVGRLSSMGVEQDLGVLAEAIDRLSAASPEREALIMVSPLGTGLYAIAELSGGSVEKETISGVDVVKRVTLNFVRTGGTRQTAYYLQLMKGGEFPPQMTSAAYVGILEEYRYYVRDTSDPSDPNRSLVPRLSRARFFPGSNDAHPSNSTADEDIADNVWDLQIALGVDVNGNGRIDEGATDAAASVDEWLFNNAGDDDSDDPTAPGSWIWNGSPLELMRITALVRTDQRDVKYVSPPITSIEDRDYSEPDTPADNAQLAERRYYRRQVESTIDFRNL